MPVYFVQAGENGPVKIGWTRACPWKRAAHIGVSHPTGVRLLAIMDGDRDMERALHQRFAAHRLSGEWFQPCPALSALIAEHAVPAQKPPERSMEPGTLDEYLSAEGLTEREFAARIGVSQPTVSKYRRGVLAPNLPMALRIVAESTGRVTLEALATTAAGRGDAA